MHKIGSHLAVIRANQDTTEYYLYNFDTCMLIKFADTFPTLEAFMERARCWTGGDNQINSVTPFELMDFEPGPRDVIELEKDFDEALRNFMRSGGTLT